MILPFEEEFLREHGAEAEFVGSPLTELPVPDVSREQWMLDNGLDPERPLLGLFPGSRAQEVRRHLTLFEAVAAEVRGRMPAVQVRIGRSPDLDPRHFNGSSVPVVDGPRELLHFSTAALVKSGTTTLEAALAGTPIAVVYRMNPLSWQIAKRLVKVPHIALANLVADERLTPEFVQDDATPDAVAGALLPLLREGSPERARMEAGFSRIRERMGGQGASRRVAEIAAELLEGS